MEHSKPHIIILIHYMELGGVEMSLLGLLWALNSANVDVDLFVYSHQGDLMKHIPNWVNLLPETRKYAMLEKPITQVIKNGNIDVIIARIKAYIKHKLYRRHNAVKGDDNSIFQYIGNAITPILPKINPNIEYDLCISFLTPHNIGRDKVRAKKRLAWIHTDYSTIHINTELELSVWNAYDYIASISKDVRVSFLKLFPSLESKIIDIENILSSEYVHRKVAEFDANIEMQSSIKVLSIGRFSYQKNFDNVPDIARRLVNLGLSGLKWYIIGYGGDEALIRSKIAEAGMEKHVIILGKKENPYPYIKACDIYVQPSRYEGKSVTVREAQMLGKPVVVTNYPTASSQINDGVDGVIVPLDNEGCARGLAAFIANEPLQNDIVAYLKTHDYAHVCEVNKIYDLLK